MELHIGPRFFLLANIAKTITNCADVLIPDKEYETLDGNCPETN